MVNFTVGNFNYLVTSSNECNIGGNPSVHANAPINGMEFSGIAAIPSRVEFNGIIYNVTAVGNYAFRGCSKMTKVILPNTIKILYIDGFFGTMISTFTIPSSVELIKGSAFSHMSNLKKIIIEEGSKLKTLEGVAFGGLYRIESIIIPSSIKYVGGDVFYSDNMLKSIVVCGSEDFSSVSNPFNNIGHSVKVYVTPKYPEGATFGGNPVTVVDNICSVSFYHKNKITCHQRKQSFRNFLFIMIFGLC